MKSTVEVHFDSRAPKRTLAIHSLKPEMSQIKIKMNEVQFSSQLSFQEFFKASLVLNYRRPIMMLFTVLGGFMFVTAILFYLGFSRQFGQMPLVQLFLSVYFLVLLPLLIYFRSRKSYGVQSRVAERMSWTVDGEWIAIKGESFETKMTWDKIRQVVETKDVFLIYQSKVQANIVSKREMSPAQVQGFRYFVKGVLGLKHKLRAD